MKYILLMLLAGACSSALNSHSDTGVDINGAPCQLDPTGPDGKGPCHFNGPNGAPSEVKDGGSDSDSDAGRDAGTMDAGAGGLHFPDGGVTIPLIFI
jgi:hypothetical protein